MAIWFKEFPLSYAQERGRGTLIEHLGIELLEAGDDYLKARMPVNGHTRQPAGMLHGGASVALAETLASWAATFCVDPGKHHCVGIEINANHLRPMAEGYVLAGSAEKWRNCLGLGASVRGREYRGRGRIVKQGTNRAAPHPTQRGHRAALDVGATGTASRSN
jgi:1,4-dihydroxy-2-naphthoyl-CoA hydrolase